MGLAIGVRRGDTVYVEDTPVKVVGLEGFAWATILVGAERTRHDIFDDKQTEILPGVFVQLGSPPRNRPDFMARLVFEAPRSVTILREALYRGKVRNPQAGPGKGRGERDNS